MDNNKNELEEGEPEPKTKDLSIISMLIASYSL